MSTPCTTPFHTDTITLFRLVSLRVWLPSSHAPISWGAVWGGSGGVMLAALLAEGTQHWVLCPRVAPGRQDPSTLSCRVSHDYSLNSHSELSISSGSKRPRWSPICSVGGRGAASLSIDQEHSHLAPTCNTQNCVTIKTEDKVHFLMNVFCDQKIFFLDMHWLLDPRLNCSQ